MLGSLYTKPMIVEKEKSGHPIVQQEQPSVLIQVVDIKAQFQFSRATLRIISTNDSWTKNPSFVALVLVSSLHIQHHSNINGQCFPWNRHWQYKTCPCGSIWQHCLGRWVGSHFVPGWRTIYYHNVPKRSTWRPLI